MSMKFATTSVLASLIFLLASSGARAQTSENDAGDRRLAEGRSAATTKWHPKVFCLEKSRLPDGTILFWDNTDAHGGLVFVRDYEEPANHDLKSWESWKRGALTKSNAAVIIFDEKDAANRRDTLTSDVAWAEGSSWSMESVVKSWVDVRGFVHSIDVLRRQLAHNDWAWRYATEEPRLEVTGILDRQTLWSESQKMHHTLRSAQRKLAKARMNAIAENPSWEGGSRPGEGGQPAEVALQPAVDALSRYDGELRGVRFAPPATRPAMCDWAPRLFYSPPKHQSLGEQFKNIDHLRADFGRIIIYRNVIQDSVTESVDPGSLDSGAAERLAQLEIEARRRIRDAAALVEETLDASN